MSNIVLSAKGLHKSYHDGKLMVDVLTGIDFELQRGEQVAIVGASGSGKSTLLHLLGGLDKPTTGDVLVDGEPINRVSEKRRCELRNEKIGFVYQMHYLLPEFTVLENVAMPLLLRQMSVSAAEKQAKITLDQVGLSHRLEHKLGELSGGERQRTAIARALVTKPLCVLADEPTGNLDHQTAETVYKTMLELNQTLGTSFVIVTHDLSLAARLNKRYSLIDGKLSLEGTSP
ncbi:MAG: lipoprotein-releasing ABC transporter ATP-binding protein LolD [Gammaproteobacteria bacterium]|nr:lipoprotein-releasing ABC transporter ATP-binding protein LolD [Gammaproteobacteria bacterium]